MSPEQNALFEKMLFNNHSYHAEKNREKKKFFLEELKKIKQTLKESMGEEEYLVFMAHGRIMEKTRKKQMVDQIGEEGYKTFVKINKTLWDEKI